MSSPDPLRRPRKVPDAILFILGVVVGLISAIAILGSAWELLNTPDSLVSSILSIFVSGLLLFISLQAIQAFLFPPFRRGRCPYCGYDVRATPTRTTLVYHQCPECGRITPRWSEYDE